MIIVLFYFIVLIFVWISVVGLGLIFELNEEVGVDYLVMMMDWRDLGWIIEFDFWEILCRFVDFVLVGLVIFFLFLNKLDLVLWIIENVDGLGVNWIVDGCMFIYIFFFNEYCGLEVEFNKDYVVYSLLSCIVWNFYNGMVY